MDPHTLLSNALDALNQASDDLFTAADMMSDLQAEYHGDRGLGVPARNRYIDSVYALSSQIAAAAELLAGMVDHDE
jgi:hypothetical protein